MVVSVLYESGSEMFVNAIACETFLEGTDVGAVVGVPGASVVGAAMVGAAVVGLSVGLELGLTVGLDVRLEVVGAAVGAEVGAVVGLGILLMDTLCTTSSEIAVRPLACRND